MLDWLMETFNSVFLIFALSFGFVSSACFFSSSAFIRFCLGATIQLLYFPKSIMGFTIVSSVLKAISFS